MSPPSRGFYPGGPSTDNVLHLLGLRHARVNIQLLITIGFVVLGMGTLETSTLLPLPLYGCWSAINATDLNGKELCKNIALLDPTVVYEEEKSKLWACGADDWWQPTFWPGMIIVGVRTFIAICAGVGLDIFGRRRCVIAWMGAYFVFSFARSFSPRVEVFVMSVTMEGLCAQAASMALLLLAIEGSTQKECVRSACLVLMGHALGMTILVPLVCTYVKNEMFRQLARSIPSVFFVLFIFLLPESFRWLVVRGRVEHLSATLSRSHDVELEDSLRSKLTTVYHETRKCLSACRSRGNPFKEAVCPLILCRSLSRIFFPIIGISFIFGNAISFRLLHDPLPYQSVEDRLIAFGVAEILALQLTGLLLARLPVRRVLFSTAAVFTVIILLTKALTTAGYLSCVADIFLSTGGHFLSVLLWTWLVIGVARLTPTHSRGTIMGITIAFGTLGHSMAPLVYNSLKTTLRWREYSIALLYGAVVILGGLLVLFLPSTPRVLPDMTSHVNRRLPKCNDNDSDTLVVNGDDRNPRPEENTRL